jgi:peptidoglycan/LPS O-acetylase OafA/YrhL
VDQGFSHAWSLCVEEHFYLFLPLIVLAMMRKPSFRKTARAGCRAGSLWNLPAEFLSISHASAVGWNR